ncbi:serine hydrolase [Oleiagrimonas soli]|uniref:Beta-lactamase n=1 Tax=Oleiagrimonas soli TaxID=1543381 RepID=A0A099CUP1_9GAMM|nr:serine hydrolase [Oleiagrimonas soli]KGI77648.1 beta-lactamase [Oleiagrimonas soli]MBB6182846.1 CubicO group peptidase (beta-lactamase class C family) [Oleiagrimonas soli]
MRIDPITRRLFMVLALAAGSALSATPALATDAAQASTAAKPAVANALPAQLSDFTDYVNGVRKQFDVPGIAVAIVKDGKVVLAQGYGVRTYGTHGQPDQPVDAHTIFAIASNTKAFTAASLSMLADEGKLDMGDRVIDHLPWFRMSDPYITHEMRIRDLLAHHSGLSLGAGDLLYWPTTDYTTKQVIQHLAHVPIKNGFRERYFYDNILFGVAELVIENVSGESYRHFLKTRFFEPLGMHDTRFNYHYIQPSDHDVATGYAKYDFKDLKPVAKLAWANNSGAGGIYSSVHDMAKWIIAQLDGGVYGENADGTPKRLFSEKRHEEMWSVQTAIHPSKPEIPELAAIAPDYAGYGEGWHLSEFRGHKVVYHTGGWPGFVSRVTMIPDLKLGMVVLTNQQSGAAFQAVTYRILDAYMHAPKTDWTAVYAKAEAKSEAKADDSWKKHEAARDKHSKPSLPLSGYAGTYRDPWYGDVGLRVEGGHLVMQFSHTKQLLGDLKPWQHDTFIVHWRDRSLNADAFVTFALDADGHVREMRMKPVSPLTDFSFDFQDLRLKPVKKDG